MRFSTHFLATITLLITACASSHAALVPPLGANPNFSRLMMEGSSASVGEILALRQDKYGFMWIGGTSGLARYDGYRFKVFVNNAKDKHSLSANFVRDIFEDSRGRLWIATENGGILRYNRALENFDRIDYAPGSFTNNKSGDFYHIMEDSHHVLWVAGRSSFGFYDEASGKLVQANPGSASSEYLNFGIAQISDDEYVLATSGGMFYWNRKTNREIQYMHKEGDPASLANNELRDVLVDSRHNIWVATDMGISRFRPETRDFENFVLPNTNPHIIGTPVYCVYEDSAKMLWLATDGNGLMYFDPVSKQYGAYTSNASYASLARAVVRRVYQDRAGDLWIGMYPLGVSHYDRSNNDFTLYNNFIRDKDGLFKNQVLAFQEDDDGSLWLGIDNLGLVHFDRRQNTFTQRYHGVDFSTGGFPKTVLSLLRDSHDNIWLGAWAEGVTRFNLRTNQRDFFKTPAHGDAQTAFPGKHVWAILEARNGDIYFGTMGDGFVTYSYATGKFTAHPRNPELTPDRTLASGNIWCMYQDIDGKIWMGTSGGVDIYDPVTGLFRHYHHDPDNPRSLSHDWVTSFLRDSKGRMWITTMDGGLNLWHPDTASFTHYRADDGIGTDSTQGVLEDRNGMLWISTQIGLAKFDPGKNVFKRYSQKSWLQNGEFKHGSLLRLRNGQLAFGGVNGFNIFDPGKASTNDYVPPIYFTELKLFDKDIVPQSQDSPLKQSLIDTRSITLNYDQDVFSLVFTALNYRVYEDNQYRYMLEGFDKDWRDANGINRVTYTHLDAGTYTFRVRASNDTGLWNPQEKDLQIIVLPAPWRTWWAYSLYALLVFGIISWYLHVQRSKIKQAALLNAKLLELDRLKDNFMANTSHELRTPVNGILGMAHALRDGDGDGSPAALSPASKEKLDVILSCGKRLARLVNTILDFSAMSESQLLLKRGCVNLASLLPEVIEECRIQHTHSSVSVENHIKPELPMVFADEARTVSIFYNIISNAFKFTEHGFVRITASATDTQVSVKIADSGMGIAQEDIRNIFSSFSQVAHSGVHQKNGTGLGMAMTKYLVELHGGALMVESTRGVGSVFTVTLPRATDQQLTEFNAARSAASQPAAAAVKETHQHSSETGLPVYYPKSYQQHPQQILPRILVVDDEPVNRMVLRHMLLKRNYIVYEAANGQEAVDAIDQGFVCDLILLDIMMPKLSGLEACRQIRHRHPSSHLPIIFVTAKTQQQDRDECIAAGGDDFLTKPVANDDLYAHMDALMTHDDHH